MSFVMPNETSSPNSRASTSSMHDEISSFNSRASTSSMVDHQTLSPNSRASTSSRQDRNSSPNPRASSSSMPNLTLSYMSRSSSSAHRQREPFSMPMPAACSYSPQPSPRIVTGEEGRRKVVVISVATTDAANDDFFQDKFLSGDLVQRVAGSDGDPFTHPFPSGSRGLLSELQTFHKDGVRVLTIQVERCGRLITRRASIVPLERQITWRAFIVLGKKKHKFALQDFDDPSHIFTFDDYTLESCSSMQDQGLRDAQKQLSKMRVAAMDVPCPWKREMQSANGFSMVYSMLVVPHAISMSQSSTLENAVLQAMTWLHVSKASKVPLIFRNVQTEPIIAEASEQSLNVNLSSILNSGTYSLEQSQGNADRLAVIRAIRIWYAFHAPEVMVELEAMQGENLLGVTIGRTTEGFCYVTEVVRDTAAFRAGLKERLDAAKARQMRLVVTKVGNERVLPWLISNGSIRCYDVNSISHMLSSHCRAGKTTWLHLLDIKEAASTSSTSTEF